MNTLAVYVRKEWREQRVGLFALLVALPILFGIACVVFGETAAIEELLRPGVAAACGALIVLFGIGSDLIPGEMRRSHVRFLARLPAGLGRAFAAKVVFFATTTSLVAVYAAGIALGASLLLHGALPDAFLGAVEERSVLIGIALALWIVAALTWVPQGALAIPAAAAVAVVLCSPVWFFFGPHSILAETIVEVRAFAALCALGACASAWTAFVFGCRFGYQPSRAALGGALVAVASLAPAWAWSAYRLNAAQHCDPNARGFWIEDVRLTADGQKAEVDGCLGASRETLTVDLHGAFARVGQNASFLFGHEDASRLRLFSATHRAVGTRVWCRPGRWLVQDGRTHAYELYDPSTQASVPADLAAADRVGATLPDGCFLVARDGEVFTFDPESSERTRIAIAGGRALRIDSVQDAVGSSMIRPLAPPFVVVCGGPRPCLARLDLEHHELVPALGSEGYPRFVALGTEDSAIVVEDNRRLVRVRFGTDEREVILPGPR